ncbi:hypothetical protein HanRHA438_Chr17g0837841 [Helianthus annuus]|nr:hypothetical protein HanHA89_Chr17g0727011 [Helianthus annuus]KAJ0828496.1 hypothetical protein HanRHA438_Chr17g0837841 [Helianthus annuus]
MQMKVSVTSTMFTNLTCKLSKCVCVVPDRKLSTYLSISRVCTIRTELTHTLHGYLYPAHDVWSEGSDRWSEGSSIDDNVIEGSAWTSKDHLSRSINRSLSFDAIEGSTISFDWLSFDTEHHLSTFTNCCPSQTGGWLTWSTYKTDKDIVYIVTEYRQSTDTSAPTNSPLAVALSLSSIVVDSSRTSMVFGLRVLKTLMSFQVFKVRGSSKSSRLESRECINKLPVSCRKCVDKLPLNISSPLSYARE